MGVQLLLGMRKWSGIREGCWLDVLKTIHKG